MKAWVYGDYGSVDVLKFDDKVSIPEVNDDQVLVRVFSAGLNPVDAKRRQGKFKATDSPLPLAKQVFGASRVAATASTGKLELLKSLGVDLAIDYTKQNFEDLPEKFDVVVFIGSRFVVTSNGEVLKQLNPYLESGKVKPVIDPKGPFPFFQLKLEGINVNEEETLSEPDLLTEIMEIREAVEEAPDSQALNEIKTTMQDKLQQWAKSFANALHSRKYDEAITCIRRMTYYDRVNEEIVKRL